LLFSLDDEFGDSLNEFDDDDLDLSNSLKNQIDRKYKMVMGIILR